MKNLQQHEPSTNMTISQEKLLHLLKWDNLFIVLMSDKNLGPAVIERDKYISVVLKEHLNDGVTYRQMDRAGLLKRIDDFKSEVHDVICYEEEGQLTDSELTFFGRGFFNSDRIPQFYGMPKIHKETVILPWRPVTSQCESASAIVSKYIDYYLQKYIHNIPS